MLNLICSGSRFSLCRMVIVLVFFISCKKSSNETGGSSPFGDPVVTAKGQPVGLAVTKSIDAAGGTLSTPDGKLTITVPAGTVLSATTFSIQPITNTLHEDKPAYRLLPEGVTLAKPVQLSFRYSNADLVNTAEDLLVLFFQTNEGSWKRLPTALDKAQKLITASTTHFSDWVASGALQMEIRKKTLTAGESSEILILGAVDGNSDWDLLAPLTPSNDFFQGFISKMGNWKVLQGRGTVTGKASTNPAILSEATYKAPASIPQPETVTLQVEIEGKMTISGPGRNINIQKVILLGEIKLLSDVYMLADFGGTTLMSEVTAFYGNGAIGIGGTSPNLIVTLRANGNSAAVYSCGGFFDPLKCFIDVSADPTSSSNKIYISSYMECGPPRIERYSQGSLKITKWGGIGETVEGEFNGPVYTDDGTGCGVLQKNLRVQFRTVRSV
jgi:hypothetical protein